MSFTVKTLDKSVVVTVTPTQVIDDTDNPYSELTLADLKKAIAESSLNVPVHQQRLVCQGKVIATGNSDSVEDDDASTTLTSLHVSTGATIHLTQTQASSSSRSPMARVPATGSSSAALDPLQRIMSESPFLKRILDNPDLMSAMLKSDPAIRALTEKNPEFRAALDDPEMLRTMMRAATNPSIMNEMKRNQDRALSNIEMMPGGFNYLSSMYRNLQDSLDEGRSDAQDQSTEELNQRFAAAYLGSSASQESGTSASPNDRALPNPWAPPPSAATRATLSTANPFGGSPLGLGGSPFGAGGSPLGAGGTIPPGLLAMLGMPPPTPATSATNPTPPQPGNDPNTATMLALLESLRPPSSTTTSNTPSTVGFPSGNGAGNRDLSSFLSMMSALNNPGLVGQPASSPLSTPAQLVAPAVSEPPPEERYKEQLEMLDAMGFHHDRSKKVRALMAAGGNVDAAINYLLDMP
ncbi:hypothetical protein BJ742DRAFT_769094 [Cladochytrium replicatum]|nr:hypothetical protein BJ742DRAFT_769094 [Cladochytrium replicatum]